MSLEKPRTVFFDLAHTLVRGSAVPARRSLGARLNLDERQIRRVGKLIMTYPATAPEELLPALGEVLPGIGSQRIERELEAVWREQQETAEFLEGALGLLESLKEAGIRLGLISNTWHPFYAGFVAKHPEAQKLFDLTVLSYRCGVKKPSSAIYRRALEASGCRPGECWMVGDSYELDILPSLTLGMNTLWVLVRPEAERPVLAGLLRNEGIRPRWVVDELKGVRAYFRRCGFVP